MESQSFANPAGWGFVLLGIGLAALASLIPHFAAGYFFDSGVFIANLLPYLVYAIAVPLAPGAITTSVGFILVAAHTGLVLSERFIGGADYSDGLIYSFPLVLAILAIPLAAYAMIKTGFHKVTMHQEEPEASA